MKHILTSAIREDREYTQLLDTLNKQFKANKPLPVVLNGLCEGASEALLVSLLEELPQKRCALVLCPEEKDCVRLVDLMARFGKQSAFFTGRDLTFYNITASHEFEHERLDVLFALQNRTLDVVFTTPDAALGYTVPPEKLANSVLRIDMKTRIDPSDLSLRLLAAGYSRADMVDGKGQFAIRGGIVDIYPPNGYYTDGDGKSLHGSMALRIELFDDEIDRMGLFDVHDQRMQTTVESAEIPPAREILIDATVRESIKKAIGAQFKQVHDERAEQELIKEAAAIEQSCLTQGDIAFADKYISLIYPERACLLDYFPERSCVFLIGTNNVYERLKASEWHRNQTIEELLAGKTLAPRYADYAKSNSALDVFLGNNVTVHVDAMSYGHAGHKIAGLFTFRSKHTVSYGENYSLLFEDLNAYLSQNYRVLLLAESKISAENLCGLFRDKGLNIRVASEENETFSNLEKGSVLILSHSYISAYELVAPRIAVLSTVPDMRRGNLAAAGRIKKSKKKKSAAQAILSYADLEIGDFVVHENYGIGKYTGIETMTVAGVTRDYIGIQYAGSDKLFLPTEKLDKVSKYIGSHADDGQVKLSKFGGNSWSKAKEKARASVKDIAKDLIRLYAERERRPGFAFPEDDEFQRNFEAAFEYEETEGQLRAAQDVKRDMTSRVPMDRLLCGDVGFGKTEVALRAAYKAVMGGKQVAVLVPTTILALQHFQTFSSRMRPFGVNVDMISRFKSTKEQSLTLRRLRRGEVDVLIGTHRLIGKGIEFHDLGLLIVDEEQRFGVAQKEKLKQMAQNVDVLTLSATPIPRTLNMAMGGLRDISVLDEAPGDRLPVQTYVLEEDELIIGEAIRRELRRGGQVFYLHNAVDTIDDLAAKLSREFPDARVTVAHGKMERDSLEDIWEKMLHGEIDILVCTTIIETGVDVANANTLIVDHAHRLGLSQLHQLRGRVGRSSRRAYAYFTYPKYRALSEIAQKRLEAIRDYAEFGAGFKIALRDMEIRGAGNLLGTEQHGHMDAVGYDLYIKLLNEAVLSEKGEAPKPEAECTVSLELDAYIPDFYVTYPSQRMDLYKKIAMIENEHDRDDILDEMIDRFGNIPKATTQLLDIALIRADGKRCGIKQIRQENADIQFYPEQLDFEVWTELSTVFPGRLRMAMNGEPHLNFKCKSGENTLSLIHQMFQKYIEISQTNVTQA